VALSLYLHAVVVDAKDPVGLAQFWADALGYETHSSDPGWAWITDPTGKRARMSFQYEREPKTSSNRLHLDLKTDDVDTEVQRLSQLGATVKKEFREPEETVIVMQDPEGNEFCVCSL
jgi:predicted enzyme related to lactoylglutathione lyase